MKILLFLGFFAFLSTICSAQEDIKMTADYDAELNLVADIGGNGGIRVLSPYDDLVVIVSSGNQVGEMKMGTDKIDGLYEYSVIINIDNGREAHFIFSRRGSTIKAEFSEKRLREGLLLGYRIKSVNNPIRLSFQPSVGDMYPSATEALVEISTAFEKLNIYTPTIFPFEVTECKQENDSSINVYKIVVPVVRIKELKDQFEEKSKAYEALDKILMESADGDDPRWEELDRLEQEVNELQVSVASVQQIDLDAPESNSLSIDISQMGPRSKMVVAVVPLTQTIVKNVYKNPYDDYMSQAQNAYDNRKYGTAKKLYLQAWQTEGITTLQATTAQECANMMDGLASRLQVVKNCAATWRKMQESGQVQRHLAEECLELAMYNLQQLHELTHDEFYATRQRKYQQILSAFPVVIEGNIRVKNYYEGIMQINSLKHCEIYACTSPKDKTGTYIGDVNNDGTFHIQFDRGQYVKLLLKPLPDSPLKSIKEINLKNKGKSSMTITRDYEPN